MMQVTKNTSTPDAEDLANLGQAVHRLGMQVVSLSLTLKDRDQEIAELKARLAESEKFTEGEK